jgi:hypothetical protein
VELPAHDHRQSVSNSRRELVLTVELVNLEFAILINDIALPFDREVDLHCDISQPNDNNCHGEG